VEKDAVGHVRVNVLLQNVLVGFLPKNLDGASLLSQVVQAALYVQLVREERTLLPEQLIRITVSVVAAVEANRVLAGWAFLLPIHERATLAYQRVLKGRQGVVELVA
jgi:hypothetical protein